MFGKCCLLVLHGSGGNGREIREFLEEYPIDSQNMQTFHQLMDSIDCDIHTPTSKVRRYSAAGGERMNVWFDRSPRFQREGLDSEEDTDGVTQSIRELCSYLLEIEGKHHYDHYFLGGFSMGGGCNLHFLRDNLLPHVIANKVRGMFTMGSFLVQKSAVMTQTLLSRAKDIPIVMLHGEHDSLIPCDWGRKTGANLLVRELNVVFRSYPRVDHEMAPPQVSFTVDMLLHPDKFLTFKLFSL
jgi:predicted esterase